MNIQTVAIAAMILLGLLAGVAAVLVVLRRGKGAEPKWKPVFLGVLAFGLLGVGAYGPSFLEDYSGFLKEIATLRGTGDPAKYERVVADLAGGKVPAEYRPLVESHLLQHPPPGLEGWIRERLPGATQEGRASLLRMQEDLQHKTETASLAAKALTSNLATPTGAEAEARLGTLDRSSLLLLRSRPRAELEALRVDPATLERVIDKRSRATVVPP